MEPVGEEELDYEDEDYVQKKHFHTGGAISALAEEELLGEEDEYDDLYNDVNVGEDFIQSINNPQLAGTANGAEQGQDIGLEVEFPHREVNEAEIPGIGQEGKPSVKEDGVDYAEVEQQKSGGGGVKDLEEGADECAGSGSNPAVSISAPPPLKERRIEEVGLGKADAKNGSLGHRGSGAVGLVKGAGDTGPASGKGGSPISGSGGGRGGAVLGSNRSGPNRSSLNENTGRHAGSNSHSGESGGTMLFVGELHWWTTDAEPESVFPAVGTVGLPGVALHVNPAFFGRGMATNGMGVIPSGGMDGPQTGMWADPTTGGWGGEEHNRRMKEVSYVDDMGSEYGYSEISHERGGRSSAPRDKERGSDRDWAGTSERRRRDDREADWTRDRYREEKDGYMDQRQRERDWENEDDWEKEKPSRSRIKVRNMDQEDPRSRSKEADYGKRRRLPAELNE